MTDYLIYGKIIVDDIRLRGGGRVLGLLGGGGPQGVFGARVWSDSVGFLSRSGTDLETGQLEALCGLDADLGGWVQYPGIPTPRSQMQYDTEEYLIGGGLVTSREDWLRLLDQPLILPATYRKPRAIHLITEFPDEPMVASALALGARGAVFSLEPLAGSSGNDWDAMLALIARVDVVAPDWPTASGIAGSDDPKLVIRHWASLGPKAVAVRHGARGSYVWSGNDDQAWHIPAVPMEVVDPTGAGNAYGGGWCVGWTETHDTRLAGCQGAVSASLLLRQVGLPRMSATVRREAQSLLGMAIAATRRL